MARQGKGQIVSKTELAEFYGVSATTIEHWIRVGCPFITRGGKGLAWSFSTADVYNWRLDRMREEMTGKGGADEAELKRRLALAKTETAELELAKARAEVAPVDQYAKAWIKAFAEIRANMRNIPGRVVTQLIGETDETRFKSVLLAEIDQALEGCASIDLISEEDLQIDEDPEV